MWRLGHLGVNYRQLKLGGLRLSPKTRRHRLVDRNPIADILCGVHVGNGDMPALEAGEAMLTGSVAFITETTAVTGPRGVARVHKHHHNTHLPGFVLHKQSQLVRESCARL